MMDIRRAKELIDHMITSQICSRNRMIWKMKQHNPDASDHEVIQFFEKEIREYEKLRKFIENDY